MNEHIATKNLIRQTMEDIDISIEDRELLVNKLLILMEQQFCDGYSLGLNEGYIGGYNSSLNQTID